jgi:hypothetical protein
MNTYLPALAGVLTIAAVAAFAALGLKGVNDEGAR